MSEAHFQPAALEQHRAFLRRLARELVRGEAAAEDLVQETFLRALERPPRSAGALAAWLARVARRLALNQARGAGRARVRERASARAEAQPPHDVALADLELQELLLAALKALEEPYRTTLWLRWHEGLGPGAIARREGVAAKTVEARLVRGLARLREELDRRAHGDRARWFAGVAALARGDGGSIGLVLGANVVKKLVVAAVVLGVCGWLWSTQREGGGTSSAPTAATLEPAAAHEVVQTGEQAQVREAAKAAPIRATRPAELVVRLTWSDGAPAADVTVFLFQDGPLADPRFVLERRSDANGEARFEELVALPYRLECDRGEERTLVLAQGEERELEFTLARGLDLAGSVLDERGEPVGGAELVLLSPRRDWLAARVLATTRPDGGYALRDLPAGQHLTARVPGLVPAVLLELAAEMGPRHDFVLAWVGLGLRGRVLDPYGQAVEGALVAAGNNQGANYFDPDQGSQERFGMPVTRTDEGGRFALDGIEHAELCVFVMAPDFPILVDELPFDVGRVTYAELVLAPSARLLVEVRAPDGGALEGAEVRVVEQGGRQGANIPFPLPKGTSDATGVALLFDVDPGEVTLVVEPPSTSRLHPSVARVTLAEGEERRLVVTLPHEATIHGLVRYQDGRQARGGVLVYRDGSMESVELEEEGRFRVLECDSPPYVLMFRDENGRILAEKEGVGPGPEPVELVLANPATLTGVFQHEEALDAAPVLAPEDLDGRRLGSRRKLVAFVSERSGEARANATWDGDAFTFTDLAPGTYRLTIRTRESVLYRSDWMPLAAGERHDLGALRASGLGDEAPGSLSVRVTPADVPRASGVLRGADFEALSFVQGKGGELSAEALAPGEYWLDLRADGHASELMPVTIASVELTSVSVTLRPGVARTLDFRASGPRAWHDLEVCVRDAEGRTRAVDRLTRQTPEALLVLLPVGSYTLEARADTGLTAHGAFTIDALDVQDEALHFPLR
jgi:RNA polymerase sigma-70 factor (ECF subfamily)